MQRMDFLMRTVLEDLQMPVRSPSKVASKSNNFITLADRDSDLQPDSVTVFEIGCEHQKTSNIISLALFSSEKLGFPVLIFSSETSSLQMARQFVSAVGRIDNLRLRAGSLSDSEWPRLTHTIERLRHLPIHIRCGSHVSLPKLDAAATRFEKNVGHIGLLILDIECLYEWKSFFRQKQLFPTNSRVDFIKQLAKKRKCRIALYSRSKQDSNYDRYALTLI